MKKLFTLLFTATTTIVSAQLLNVAFQAHYPYPTGVTAANICGYLDTVGNEYALVGASTGLSIMDVTIPSFPVSVYQHIGPTGSQAEWQEIKTMGKYIYVTTEQGGGLQIFNASSLPNAAGITMHSWTGDSLLLFATGGSALNSIHALHIDGHFVYLYGSNLFNGDALVLDLTDPWNPSYAGHYHNTVSPYVHDGYVRNDTGYFGHIYNGFFDVVDFTNKSNPILLASHGTPNAFTHNTWLSTNSKICFTTDEVSGSFLASFDVSNLSNIILLDKIQSNPGSGSIVHNTHILNVAGNDYAITSWYRDGFTIVDAGRPQNLVQVGNYDMYAASGNGFNGTWGVYPFLPSNTIVCSNIEDGLYVFSPTYVRACYLEGVINDSVCGALLQNVNIQVTAASINDFTDIAGDYKTGTPTPGTYTVVFSKAGYVTKTITGVVLSPGVVNTINVQLVPNGTVALTGSTFVTSSALPNTNVLIQDAVNSYPFVSDGLGLFSSCNVIAATDYDITVGKWGYDEICLTNQTINASSSALSYTLVPGYYDDFTFNLGWIVNGTATVGVWTRAVPLGTVNGSIACNPGFDVSSDCNNFAFVTGNAGGSAGLDDVDNGTTILTSPAFDLTSYPAPYLNYSRWFYNDGGSGSPNDSLIISINNGLTSVVVETVTAATAGSSTWVPKTFFIPGLIAPTSNMHLIIYTADQSPGHLVEAGFDKFEITDQTGIDESSINNSSINVYPNPFVDAIFINYELHSISTKTANIEITDVTGRLVDKIAITQNKGSVELKPTIESGIYFVHIVNGNEINAPVKIVKLK